MAIGLYGGSFDPIHFGHLITTQAVLEKRKLDKIIFMPSYISPLKQESEMVKDYHRLEMVRLAISQFPQLMVSDYEIIKKDVSYTFDTLIELKKQYNDIELIIGLDNLMVFEKWRNPDEIFQMCKVIVMKRHSDNLEAGRNKYFEKAIFAETPNIEISSTEIRNRVKNNLSIDFLVPSRVSEYIYQNGLYK